MGSSAKTNHFSSLTLESTTTKSLYSAMTDLLGTSKTLPLPSVHLSCPLSFRPSSRLKSTIFESNWIKLPIVHVPRTTLSLVHLSAPSTLFQRRKLKRVWRRCLSNPVTLTQFLLQFSLSVLHNFCLFSLMMITFHCQHFSANWIFPISLQNCHSPPSPKKTTTSTQTIWKTIVQFPTSHSSPSW